MKALFCDERGEVLLYQDGGRLDGDGLYIVMEAGGLAARRAQVVRGRLCDRQLRPLDAVPVGRALAAVRVH